MFKYVSCLAPSTRFFFVVVYILESLLLGCLPMRVLSFSVGIGLSNLPIWILSYLGAIWKHDIFLAIRELDRLDSIFLDTLYRAIREYTLFLTICEDTLYSAIREAIRIQ